MAECTFYALMVIDLMTYHIFTCVITIDFMAYHTFMHVMAYHIFTHVMVMDLMAGCTFTIRLFIVHAKIIHGNLSCLHICNIKL